MNPILILAMLVSTIPFLTGCVSRREMLARHEAACYTYGFTPGTETFANCLLQLEVSDYGYGHHGRRRPYFQPVPPPAPSDTARPLNEPKTQPR